MPTNDGSQSGVSVSPDGRQLTLSFPGAPAGTGLCEAEYTAEVAQSATAVSISTHELPGHGTVQPPDGGSDQPQMVCASGGVTRTVTVTLQSPLGNRVVVDSRGIGRSAGTIDSVHVALTPR